jgi:hypothetical protein
MKTRTDLLNHLAEKYELENYLEIGLQNADQNFNKIICPYKISVDPDPIAQAHLQMTSDEYFETFPNTVFGLIFIDGLHTAEQVQNDFENALKVLSPDGFIVLHDCNPEKEEHTIVPRPTPTGHWNGNVWRFAAALYGYEDLWRYTVDIDNGCMVIRPKGVFKTGISEMPWKEFDANRKKYLNLISWDEFVKL